MEFQNTVRQFLKGWMDKLEKCVYCAYQKWRNVTKVGRPAENELFVVLEEEEYFSAPQEFALRGERRSETALRCFRKLEKN